MFAILLNLNIWITKTDIFVFASSFKCLSHLPLELLIYV